MLEVRDSVHTGVAEVREARLLCNYLRNVFTECADWRVVQDVGFGARIHFAAPDRRAAHLVCMVAFGWLAGRSSILQECW